MGVCNGVELDDAVLTGDRLELRPWRADDAPAVLAAMTDASMHEFLALPRPYTPADALEFVTVLAAGGRAAGTRCGCAIEVRGTARVVGAAELRLGDAPHVGYWTDPAARGHGYAAEAVRMLAEFGFGPLGLPRIGLDCDAANLASVRTAQLAGFTLEGVARGAAPMVAPGSPGDLARFGRLAGDDGLPIAPAFAPLPAGGLTDGVVTLRRTGPSDVPAMAETAADPVSRSWDFGTALREEPELRRRAHRAGLDWLTGRVAPMTIVDVASGLPAGEIQLRLLGPPQTGAFGYSVHPAFRGRRYTTRALRLASEWAFETGFVYLALGAKIDNVASQRVAEGAGFVRTRVAPRLLRNPDGTFGDEAQYELVRPY